MLHNDRTLDSPVGLQSDRAIVYIRYGDAEPSVELVDLTRPAAGLRWQSIISM
jgi:hypothetical protein